MALHGEKLSEWNFLLECKCWLHAKDMMQMGATIKNVDVIQITVRIHIAAMMQILA